MSKEVKKQWENFLTPEILRSNLLVASLYISAFEILKNSIVERIRNFFWKGFDEKGDIIDPEYEVSVLTKNKSPVYASLQWLKEERAICDDDLKIFESVKAYRNLFAHELQRLIMEGLPSDAPERFSDLVSLLDKIERWWIVNYEIPLNDELAGKYIDGDGIIPGPVASLKIMIDIALGSDEQAEYYINEFKKRGLIEGEP
jgi:hypothetical protein